MVFFVLYVRDQPEVLPHRGSGQDTGPKITSLYTSSLGKHDFIPIQLINLSHYHDRCPAGVWLHSYLLHFRCKFGLAYVLTSR
jgi:hypothetical protein